MYPDNVWQLWEALQLSLCLIPPVRRSTEQEVIDWNNSCFDLMSISFQSNDHCSPFLVLYCF